MILCLLAGFVCDHSQVSQNTGPGQIEQVEMVCIHERDFCILAILIILVSNWKTEIDGHLFVCFYFIFISNITKQFFILFSI